MAITASDIGIPGGDLAPGATDTPYDPATPVPAAVGIQDSPFFIFGVYVPAVSYPPTDGGGIDPDPE